MVVVRRPSVTAIVAWATATFKERRGGLFVLAFAAAIIPLLRSAATQYAPLSLARFGSLLALAQAVVLLLCTVAMVLLVIRPPGARVLDAAAEALNAAPRLVGVRIVTAIPQWLLFAAIPLTAYGLRNGTLAIVIWMLMVPVAFVCQTAFVSAVIEGTGPITALSDAFRRARLTGIPVVAALAILLALIERAPTGLLTLVANEFFPPPDIAVPFPEFPGVDIPHTSMPALMRPGEYGSAIPWSLQSAMTLANVPFFAFVTVLYTGAALSLADTDPAPAESNDPTAASA